MLLGIYTCIGLWGDLQVDKAARQITLPGRIYPSHFNAGEGLANHHLIVWEQGKAAAHALIQAQVSDRQVLDALLELGGVAGDNVSPVAWLKREDPQSPAPDVVVAGTPVAVAVRLPGGRILHARDLLEDQGQRGFLFRLGGHRAQIPLWRSGCVVCLQSCPGGRISNARYTMRHLANGVSVFAFKAAGLPADGTPVEVLLSLLEEPPATDSP